MYYYILIDKALKTIQLRPYRGKCDAAEYDLIQREFNLNFHNEVLQRFAMFHNGQKDYIDYSTFYKKYAKYKVIE
jgi:hypothetical protein